MKNNPYIEQVKSHPKIICDTEKIYSQMGKWREFFGNGNPVCLEIGTGLGNWFSKEVVDNGDKNYVGMEIKYKRLYKTAEKTLLNLPSYSRNRELLEVKNVDNFILLKDYGENIDKIFAKNELSEIYIFFPDPWAKKEKQHKKRLLQFDFFSKAFSIIQNGGKLIIKTDHREYFDFLLSELNGTDWQIIRKSYDWENDEDFANRETTEFQQLFRGQNIKINYLELQKSNK